MSNEIKFYAQQKDESKNNLLSIFCSIDETLYKSH